MKDKPRQAEQLGLLQLGNVYPTPSSTPPSHPGRPPRPPPPPSELPPLPPRPSLPAQARLQVRVVCASIGHPELGTLEVSAGLSPEDFTRLVSQAWARPSGKPFLLNGRWNLIVPSLGMPCACRLDDPLERARKALEVAHAG